ncbi:MAG: hypothetical protein RLZZ127_2207 [Planctomycetota bacterium]|jgi:predicted transcriptional regulator
MPANPQPPTPTDAELAILAVLWERGPSTVRVVHEVLAAERGTGYTTTLKALQVMHAKGLVRRDEQARSHVYAAVQRAEPVRRRLVGRLLDSAFHGSASALVQAALGAARADAAERARIRALLDAADAEDRS